MDASQTELAMIAGLIIFILFPLAVVLIAAQRGHPGLALLTFVTMFAGLGPLVGLLTLLRVRKQT
jgi:hypothetical protein